MKKWLSLFIIIFACTNPQAPEDNITSEIILIHMSPFWEFSSTSTDSSTIGVEYRVKNVSDDSLSGWETGFTFIYHEGITLTFIDQKFIRIGPNQIVNTVFKRRINRSISFQYVFLEFLSIN